MSHVLSPTILREYDIRGTVGRNLAPADATAIGRSFATRIRAAGGTVATAPPAAGGQPVVVVSTKEEKGSWAKLTKLRNTTVLETSHVLTCVLRQDFDASSGRLSA